MWLAGTVFMFMIFVVCIIYYRRNKESSPGAGTVAAKTGAYVACCTMMIMIIGWYFSSRAAAAAANAASKGMPQVDTSAPQAVQNLQKLQIASLQTASAVRAEGNARAAALEAKAGRAAGLEGKAQNLSRAGALSR
jgi:hypothetical protein